MEPSGYVEQMGYLQASKVFGIPNGTVQKYPESDKEPNELIY